MSGDDTRELGHSRSTRLTALWSRRWRARVLVVALVSAGAIGVGGYTLATVQGRAADGEQRAEQEQGRADEAQSAAEQLCAQVQSLGGLCVVDPDDLRGREGPAGPAGPGPTDEQVAEAVAAYLATFPPDAGRPPTMAEIADAVAIQLAVNPPDQGERGPGPTQEQILAAVTTYLIANPPPAGEPGQDGADGAPGQDGADGEASTVPGPAGPTGPPGPTCPEGFTLQQRQVLGPPPETWFVCVRDEEEPGGD